METPTLAYTGGTLLFFEIFAFHTIWWITYVAGEPIFKWINPSLHERLNKESRYSKLLPIVAFSIRMIFGLLVVVPSCTYAAMTTPWGPGQQMNAPGRICMASQITLWSAEVGIIINYTFEMLVHHLVCLIVIANVVLSPEIHPIRPLYIYFAIQLGDISAGSVHILRTIGRRPHSSKLLYSILIAAAIWMLSSKVVAGFWSIGNCLQSPYRMSDWLWCFWLLVWASYISFVAYRNLRWAGVISKDPLRPYSLVFCSRITIHASHVILGLAFVATIVSTIFLYGIYHEEALQPSDINLLASLSVLATALGLTSALCLRVIFPVKASQTDPWGRDLYVQCGMLTVGWWAYYGTGSVSNIERQVVMSALALGVPLFQALAKISYYYSAKDAATHYLPADPECGEEKGEKDEKPIPAAPEMARLDTSLVRKHLGMAHANLAIFLISFTLLAFDYLSLPEAGTLALISSLASQLIRSPCMLYGSFNDSSGLPFLHALLTCVGIVLELAALLYKMAAPQLRSDSSSYLTISFNYTLIATTIVASFCFEFLLSLNKKSIETTKEPVEPPKPGRWFLGPKGFVIVCLIAAQLFMLREVFTWSGPVVKEPGIWFTNFRLILNSPKTWIAATASGFMPMLLLKTLNIAAIRANRESTAADLLEQW